MDPTEKQDKKKTKFAEGLGVLAKMFRIFSWGGGVQIQFFGLFFSLFRSEACDPAGLLQSPKTPDYQKSEKIRKIDIVKNWEKETVHRPAPVQNFSLQKKKNGVHRGKISVVDMAFLVFIGFLYPPPAWKVFL